MASFEKNWVKSTYSGGREILGFACLVAMVSSVVVISLAMNREFGRNRLQSSWRILLIWRLFREC